MNLIIFCYNFMRTKNIPGFEKMMETIKNWQPDYSKVICPFTNGLIKPIYRKNEPPFFLNNYYISILKAA